MARFDSDGVRLCDTVECEFPATHKAMWADDWAYGCIIHTQGLVNLASHLGYEGTRRSVQKLTIGEMMPAPTAPDGEA